MKSILLSKTFWFVIVYVIYTLAKAAGYESWSPPSVVENLVTAASVLGLRLISRDGVTILPQPSAAR